MIQILRPKSWTKDKIIDLVNEIARIEKYNAIKNKKLENWNQKWKPFNS
jgi:hypothetical protein